MPSPPWPEAGGGKLPRPRTGSGQPPAPPGGTLSLQDRAGRSALAPSLSAVVVAVALPALLGGCGSTRDQKPAATASGVPVASVIALTGNGSAYGQDQRIGLNLPLAAANAAGGFGNGEGPAAAAAGPAAGASPPPQAGINGKPLLLMIEDGASDEPSAIAAFNLVIERGALAIIGPTLSQQAFAADPVAQRRGVPVLAPSNTATGIPQLGSFISRVSAQSSVIAPLSLDRALKLQPGIRRVAVFFAQDDAYSTAETAIFQKALAERGLRPVTVQRTQLADQDFQSQIAATLRHQPDLVVLSLQAVDGGNLIRQLRELGYRGTIVVGNGMNTPNIYPICQRHCDGILIAQAYSPELDTPANRAFVAAYAKARGAGRIPPQLTAQAYTALQVVSEALRRVDRGRPLASLPLAEARRALNAAILAGRYDTPLGEIRFDREGEVIQKNFFVARVRMDASGRSGRFQLLP